MLKKKKKNQLKKAATNLKPVVLIGKDGITQNVIQSIQQVIKKQELIKISILKTYSGLEKEELAELLASVTSSEVVFIIGRTIILYKKNKEINAYGTN